MHSISMYHNSSNVFFIMQIADILRKLRVIMVDAGCVIIGKTGGNSSAAARYLASYRQSTSLRGSDGNDRKSYVFLGAQSNKDQGSEGSWGSASGELFRLERPPANYGQSRFFFSAADVLWGPSGCCS